MKNVLLLLPNETYRAEAFINAAKKLDLHLIVGSQQRQALSELMQNRTLVVSMSNPELGATQIERAAQNTTIDAILSVDDGGLKTASIASERLGLKHISSKSVSSAQNKIAMRQILEIAGVNQPKSATYRDGDEIEPKLLEVGGFPVVTKPASLSGSIGVIRANSKEELLSAIQKTSQIQQLHGCPKESPLIIEQYIAGDEYAIDTIISNNQMIMSTIFEKPQPLIGPYFAETIYVTPPRVNTDTNKAILESVDNARVALGIDTGPVHCEIRIDDSGSIFIIELAARSIGGKCAAAIPFRNQISLEEVILMEATGFDIPPLSFENQASGVFMIPTPKAGMIRAIHGLKEARNVRWITDIDISATLNTEVSPIPYDAKYIGFIFAKAPSAKVVVNALETAHKLIELDIS